MKQEIKSRWVSALESGDSEKGVGQLSMTASFCCLGVLCDLYGKEIGVEWVDPEDGHSFFMEAWAYLPKPVIEWAGLSEPDPKIGGPQGRTLSQ